MSSQGEKAKGNMNDYKYIYFNPNKMYYKGLYKPDVKSTPSDQSELRIQSAMFLVCQIVKPLVFP